MSLLEADVEFDVVKTLPRARQGEGARRRRSKLRAKAGDRDARRSRPSSTSSRSATTSSIALMGPVDTDIDCAKKGPTGDHDGRPAGLGQDDHRRQARALPREAEASGRCSSPPTCTAPPPSSSSRCSASSSSMPVFNVAGAHAARDLRSGASKRAYEHEPRRHHLRHRRPPRDRRAAHAGARRDQGARPSPTNIFLVVDAMIGQDAVKHRQGLQRPPRPRPASSSPSSTATRAAARRSSVKEVTGKPIKFLGMGESLDKLEEFRARGHGQPHPRHGRHRRPDEGLRGGRRRGEGRRRRRSACSRASSTCTTSSSRSG